LRHATAQELRSGPKQRGFYPIATAIDPPRMRHPAGYNASMISDDDVASIVERLARVLAPPRGRYTPLLVEGQVAGWLDDARISRIAPMSDVFDVCGDGVAFTTTLDNVAARSAALDSVARALAAECRLTRWRDERYAVAPHFGAPPWFFLERAAARFFGIHTYAAHVNGVVRTVEGIGMWLARRSPEKAIDPGMLDNMVGGGIAEGQSVATTVRKESAEEAGVAPALADCAHPVGTVEICREQPDGLQRETIFVHDLWLPANFTPAGRDGEVVGNQLVALPEAARRIAIDTGDDAVTADASLVIVDFLMRHGAIAPDARDYATLDALRHPPTSISYSPAT
jgi:8-oxo-dGTP pyrophosphatase MutT (NUDIX family)